MLGFPTNKTLIRNKIVEKYILYEYRHSFIGDTRRNSIMTSMK